MGGDRGRPNLYWLLVKAVDNQKKYTFTQVVSLGVENGFFLKEPFCQKTLEETKKEARHALVTRARRYQLKPDERVVEGNRAKVPAYYGWRLKLSFDESYFTQEEYAELQSLRRELDSLVGKKGRAIHPSGDRMPITEQTYSFQPRKRPFYGKLLKWTALLLMVAGVWQMHRNRELQRELSDNYRKIEPILALAEKNDAGLSQGISMLRGFLYAERNPMLREQIDQALSHLESKKLFAAMKFPGELSFSEPIAIIPAEPRVIIYDSVALTRGSFINESEFILDFDFRQMSVSNSDGVRRTIVFSRTPMILARK